MNPRIFKSVHQSNMCNIILYGRASMYVCSYVYVNHYTYNCKGSREDPGHATAETVRLLDDDPFVLHHLPSTVSDDGM